MSSVNDFIAKSKPKVFCQTFNGVFEIRVTKDTPGAQHRVNRADKDVWYLPAKSICGFIVDADKRETAFGPTLEIVLERGNGMELIFSTPWKGNVAGGFLNRMVNIDFGAEVQLDIAGGERQTLFIKQRGKNVPVAYTRENPNGRPDWEKIETPDGVFFDRSAQSKFFADVLENTIRPRIQAATNAPEDDTMDFSGGAVEDETATTAFFDVTPEDGVITAAKQTRAALLPNAAKIPRVAPLDDLDDIATDLPF